jgi:hypothetical protein
MLAEFSIVDRTAPFRQQQELIELFKQESARLMNSNYKWVAARLSEF